MRIVIDLQACQSSSRQRGIGRYSDSLAKAIAQNAGSHEIWLALNSFAEETVLSIKESFRQLVPPERIAVFSIPGPLAEYEPLNAWRARAAELVRWHALLELNPDIIFISSLFEGFFDNVATSIEPHDNTFFNASMLYDLIPLKNQKEHLHTHIHKNWYFSKIKSLKRAELLFAISEYTRREAIDLLELKDDHVVNIYAGVSDFFRPLTLTNEASQRLLTEYEVVRPFLLYTGNLDANKNLKGTIHAYSKLPIEIRNSHQLVIVSQMNAKSGNLLRHYCKKCGLKKDEVIFTGYVPDDHLVKFYNLCKAFVFPSLHEGFGLPLLEAMSCGAACIGSNTSSIPEVIGREDALFDPRKPKEIAKAMHDVLMNADFRNSLCKHAALQASKFSWEYSAKRVLTAFEDRVRRTNAEPIKRYDIVDSESNDFNYDKLIKQLAQIDVGVEAREDDIRYAAYSIALNENPPRKTRIFLDVSTIMIYDAKTGIQRVVRSILSHLLKTHIEGYEIRLVYGDDKLGYFRYADKLRAVLLKNHAFERETESVIDYKRGDIFLGLDLSAHLFPVFNQALKKFRLIGVKIYFIVYDLLPLIRKEWFAPGMHEAFIEWMKAITYHGDCLVCISAAVADEVRNWIKQHPPERKDEVKVTHFHLGADIDNSVPTKGLPEDAESLLIKFKSEPTFLMVGTIEPRKGHSQVIAGFDQLWEQGINANLVIVGKAGWHMEAFIKKIQRHDALNKRLFWLNGISDEFLTMLYQSSSALIAASEAEGFGLPLIEAAQHHLPIIARDIAVFREVAGNHAYYYNGAEPEDLAKAVQEWLILSDSDQTPKSKGISWLTWQESSKQLLDKVLI